MPPVAPASARDLDDYRERADRFIATLDEEYYLHFAGHKERLELEAIYAEFADLTTIEQARSIGAAVNGSSGIRELWRFACEGYLGQLTTELEEKLAQAETELKTTVDGEEIPFRMIKPTIMNEADRGKRERLERLRNELVDEHLNPLYLESHQRVRDAVRQLGADNYFELYKNFGYDLEGLGDQCRAFLSSTEQLHTKLVDKLFRDRVGTPLSEAERWDKDRMMRATTWDVGFPAERMLPALRATLKGLGVDLDGQENVHLDVENRPLKDPRAFCVPIEVPDKVMLVIKPTGGADDWSALFHEAGHAEHFAHTSSSLSVEEKRLGDNAVTEGWAMLLEHLTDDAGWLSKMLDFPKPREYAAEGSAILLYFVRRYCAKLLYEIEFHQAADPREHAVPLRRAPGGRAEDHAGPPGLPLGHGRALLRERLPPGLGARVAALQLPAGEVRARLVHAARGRLARARAVVGGAAHERGRAPARGHRRVDRDGIGRRARARERRLALQRQERRAQRDAKRRSPTCARPRGARRRRTRASTRRFSTGATPRATRSS